MPRYLHEQTTKILESLPDRPDRLEPAEFEALWRKAEQIALEKLKTEQT
jgi:hypothetical protein